MSVDTPGDESRMEEELPHEGTIIALGSLPPHVEGPVTGYVRVRVHVNVANASPLSWLIRIRWWGTEAMNQLGDVLREGQVLCFPVHVSKERFEQYINDMGPLRLDVVKKDSHQVFGYAEVPLTWTDLETMGRYLEANIVHKSTFETRGHISFNASVLWGDLGPSKPPTIASSVVVRKNRDLKFTLPIKLDSSLGQRRPDHLLLKDDYDKTKYYDPNPSTFPSRLDALLEKGIALKKAMGLALKSEDTPMHQDVITVLATAKSLAPITATNAIQNSISTDFTTSNSSYPKDFQVSPRQAPVAKRIQHDLEFLLAVPLLHEVILSSNCYCIHMSTKMPWSPSMAFSCNTIKAQPQQSDLIRLRFRARGSIHVNDDFLELIEFKTLVLEIWQTLRPSGQRSLQGLVKLPLDSFPSYLKKRGEHLGYVGTLINQKIAVKNPFDGAIVGQATCIFVVGTPSQIDDWFVQDECACKIQKHYRGWSIRRNIGCKTATPTQEIKMTDVNTSARKIQKAFRAWQLRKRQVLTWAWEDIDLDEVAQPSESVDYDALRPETKATSSEKSSEESLKSWGENVFELLDKIEKSDFIDERTVISQESNHDDITETNLPSPKSEPRKESDSASHHKLDFEELTKAIELLNDPKPKLLSVEDSSDLSISEQQNHHWTIQLLESFGGKRACGVGCELRYVFQGISCTMWWDANELSLCSVNKHVSSIAPLVIEIELWWKPSSSSIIRCIGYTTLILDDKVPNDDVHIPIRWDLAAFDSRVPFLPLRITHKKIGADNEATQPKASSRINVLDSKSLTLNLLPATSSICVEIISLQLASMVYSQVQLQCSIYIGDVIDEVNSSVTFDAAKNQWMFRQVSPILNIESLHIFNAPIVIHEALLESMKMEEATIAVWHIHNDAQCERVGTTAIPLAPLLFRAEGIEGQFPILHDGVYRGRLGLRIYFYHNRGQTNYSSISIRPVDESKAPTITPNTANSDNPMSIATKNLNVSESLSLSSPTKSLDARNVQITLMEARHLNTSNVMHNAIYRLSFDWGDKQYCSVDYPASKSLVFNEVFNVSSDFLTYHEPFAISLWWHSKTKEPKLVGRVNVDLSILKWTRDLCGWYHIEDPITKLSNGQLQISIEHNSIQNIPNLSWSNSPPPEATSNEDDAEGKWLTLKSIRDELVQVDKKLRESLTTDDLTSKIQNFFEANDAVSENCGDAEVVEIEQPHELKQETTEESKQDDEMTIEPMSIMVDACTNTSDDKVSIGVQESEDAQYTGQEADSDDSIDISMLSIFAAPLEENVSSCIVAPPATSDSLSSFDYDLAESSFDVGSASDASEFEELITLLTPIVDNVSSSSSLPSDDVPASFGDDGPNLAHSEHSHSVCEDVLKSVLEAVEEIKTQIAHLTISPLGPQIECSNCHSPVKVIHQPTNTEAAESLEPSPLLHLEAQSLEDSTTVAELSEPLPRLDVIQPKTSTMDTEHFEASPRLNVNRPNTANTEQLPLSDTIEPETRVVDFESSPRSDTVYFNDHPKQLAPPVGESISVSSNTISLLDEQLPNELSSPQDKETITKASVHQHLHATMAKSLEHTPTVSIPNQDNSPLKQAAKYEASLKSPGSSVLDVQTTTPPMSSLSIAEEIARLTKRLNEPLVPRSDDTAYEEYKPAATISASPSLNTRRSASYTSPLKPRNILHESVAKTQSFDSETERIARIMQCSLRNWWDEDSSDEESFIG